MTFATVPWVHNAHVHEIPSVTVSPIQPTDAHLLYAMHERLSPESLYARYLRYRRPQLDDIAAISAIPPAKEMTNDR